MDPIKEALTFDDVTLTPKYSEILPSDVDTSIKLTENLKLKIPLLTSAMDTVTESKMAIAIAQSGGLGVIHRNLNIKKQILEIKKVKKQKFVVGAAVGAGPNEFRRAEAILKENIDMIVVDTAHAHTKKVSEIIKFIKKKKTKKTALCAGNIATPEAARFLNVSFTTCKKYAKQFIDSKSDKTLWELHKNQAGKGIRKDIVQATAGPYSIDKLLQGEYPNYPVWKLRNRILALGILPEKCNSCGYEERRITDDTTPLLLDHKDGDVCNHQIDNLQLLCLNCYYMQTGNPYNKDKDQYWNYNLLD